MVQSVDPQKPLILIASATPMNFRALLMKLQYGFRVQYTSTLHNQNALLQQLHAGFAVILLDQELDQSKASDVCMLVHDSVSRDAAILEIATESMLPKFQQRTSGVIHPLNDCVLETITSHLRPRRSRIPVC